jgi:hypothetical protein
VNAPLTNISVAFIQDQSEFIADRVFPAVPVTKQSDRYYVYDKANWFRAKAMVRAPASESAGSGFTIDSTPTYFADVYAFHKDVDDDVRANADTAINVDTDATTFVTRDLVLKKELTWAARYFAATTWTGSTTGTDVTPSILWNAGGSTPIEDMREQLRSVQRKTGFRANKIAMGSIVWDVLQDHPDFLERIKYTQVAIVTTGLLASVLGVDEVLVGGAVQNIAIEGASNDLQFVFGNDVLIVYAPPTPGLLTPTGGYTFMWTGRVGGSMRIMRIRAELLKADRIEGEMAYDQKLVAAEMGAFLLNVI